MDIMEDKIKFGIGFVTGRPNVCNVINNLYKQIVEQIKDRKIEINIFILFDLNYQVTERVDFYKIIPKAYKDIKIRYITPEDIEEEKKKLIIRNKMLKSEVELFLGHGYAKGRNTLMYFAKRLGMDYLLFWDDDEYPVASIKDGDKILWEKQRNIEMHLKYIGDADVTIGYHCGYISPIPYFDLDKEIKEEKLKSYIEAVSNDIISWKAIKEKMQNNGITYADKNVAYGLGAYEEKQRGIGKWVAGSTLCLNLRNIDKIPAFYNPPGARGEDTFFSTRLQKSRVVRVSTYHFHDGFLKYKDITKGKYPETLEKIENKEVSVGNRFLNASKGWIRYKPLLMYLTDKENYEKNIKVVYDNLKNSIKDIDELFEDCNFFILLDELKNYSKNVEKYYTEYNKVNDIWNKLKNLK